MTIAAGTVLAGRYRVIRPIGAGGMGEVYEAEQTSLGRRVAVKVLFDDDAKALARFEQEARAMARLRHPHVVNIIDFHVDGDRPLLVMDLLEGESLLTLLVREKTVWNQTRAADLLGISRRTLQTWMIDLDIPRPRGGR